ncbi:MAG: bifunctional pyr operon transcriptional regulator/uracil phosphoribosyltransferase PyrR [Bacteroidota bacterium]
MQEARVLLEGGKLELTMTRLCHQLIENHGDFSNTCLVGIQERGVRFATRMHALLSNISGQTIQYGKLDVTFYRDDFRMRPMPLDVSGTEMDFLVDQQKVILIDDVLYTGRTIRSAMDALQHYGRPEKVELLVLVDRRFNRHLPIRPNYTGIALDAVDEAYVKVEWKEIHGKDQTLIYPKKIEG